MTEKPFGRKCVPAPEVHEKKDLIILFFATNLPQAKTG